MTTTPLDHAQDLLMVSGLHVNEIRDIPHGHQLRCEGGEIVNVYHSGAVVPGGRNMAAVKALFERNPGPRPGKQKKAAPPAPVATPQKAAVEEPVTRPQEAAEETSGKHPEWSDDPNGEGLPW